MSEIEKTLRMKLLRLLEIVHEWPKEWDPEQPGLSKHSRVFYRAFHNRLKTQIKDLEKTIDDVRWTHVS